MMADLTPSPKPELIKAWEAATERLDRARARYKELDDAVTAARTEMLDAKSAEEKAWVALSNTRATAGFVIDAAENAAATKRPAARSPF